MKHYKLQVSCSLGQRHWSDILAEVFEAPLTWHDTVKDSLDATASKRSPCLHSNCLLEFTKLPNAFLRFGHKLTSDVDTLFQLCSPGFPFFLLCYCNICKVF